MTERDREFVEQSALAHDDCDPVVRHAETKSIGTANLGVRVVFCGTQESLLRGPCLQKGQAGSINNRHAAPLDGHGVRTGINT